MSKQGNNSPSTMNNQGSKEIKKENEKSPENKLKNMEDCDLIDGEFKFALFKKLIKIQEKQFNELKNKISEQRSTLLKRLKL